MLGVGEKALAPGLTLDVVHGHGVERLLQQSDVGLRRMSIIGRLAFWAATAVDRPYKYLSALLESVAKPDADGLRNVLPGLLAAAQITRLRLRTSAVVAYVGLPNSFATLGTVDAGIMGSTGAGLIASSATASHLLATHQHLHGIGWPSLQAPEYDVYAFFSERLPWASSWEVVKTGYLLDDEEARRTLRELGIFLVDDSDLRTQ